MRILLAGTHRCGSTWTYNVLARAADTRGVAEPDGVFADILGVVVSRRMGEKWPALRATDSPRWYPIIWDLAFAGGWPWDQVESARAAGHQVRKLPPHLRDYGVAMLARAVTRLRKRPRHVVVKSVYSALALEWIVARYQPIVVVQKRTPLNVISSWLALNWIRDHHLEVNPVVREDLVEPLGLEPPPASASSLARVAWMVGLLTTALKLAAERHPEWIVVSHDELCLDPRAQFMTLYSRLGLEWTPATDAYLTASDAPGYVVHFGNPRTHPNAQTNEPEVIRRERQATQYLRRLSAEQIREVESVLEKFPLGDWRGTTVPALR